MPRDILAVLLQDTHLDANRLAKASALSAAAIEEEPFDPSSYLCKRGLIIAWKAM